MVTDAFQRAHSLPCQHRPRAVHLIVQSVGRVKTSTQTRFRFWPHFWKSLIAILAGNAIYFLGLSPRLPALGQHAPGRIDLGLVIDFWACVACFGVLEAVLRFRGKRSRSH